MAWTPHWRIGQVGLAGTANVHHVRSAAGSTPDETSPGRACDARGLVSRPREKLDPAVPGSLTAEADRVAAEVESYAPLVNGKVYNNHYHMLFEIRDGKITVVKEYADTAHAREVFGNLEF